MTRFRTRTALVAALTIAMVFAFVGTAAAAAVVVSDEVAPAAPNVYRVGETIHYSLWVENPMIDRSDLVMHIWDVTPDAATHELGSDVIIAPGARVSYGLDYVVRAEDVRLVGGRRIVMNTLYASGDMPQWEDTAYGDAEKSSVIISPSFDVTKSVDYDGDGQYGKLESNLVGSAANWKIVVTNTGDCLLREVTVTDTNGQTYGPADIAVGASQAWLYVTYPEQSLTNTATVAAKDSRGVALTPKLDTAAVTSIPRDPKLVVDKSADATRVPSGTVVKYTYVVTNTGNETLYNIVATDDKLGAIGTTESLAPGKSVTFTKSATLDATVKNIVTATGWTRSERKLTAQDDWIVEVYLPFTPPDLALEKTVDRTTANPGDTVKYTLTYRNVGPGAASNFTITDDYDERYMTVVDAAGGVVAGGKITWTLAGPLSAADGPKSFSYTLKLKTSMPTGTTLIGNKAVIHHPDDTNPANDRDDAGIQVSVDFLPYTGGEFSSLLFAAGIAGGAGLMLRRKARRQG